MLTERQHDCLEVVLVSPRNPLNIGAAARAMANFGFRHLAVAAPYEEHWREAKSAVQAEELLQNARRTDSLAEAVADCTLVIGTGTLTYRKPEQRIVTLPLLCPLVRGEIARGGRAAVVFGSEKHGLTRDDLALCHLFVEIPTCPQQPSMNLGQAVAVCLYELSARMNEGPGEQTDEAMSSGERVPASSGDLDRLAGIVEETLLAANDSPAAMRKGNHYDLALLLRRLVINRHDARHIMGLFHKILWRLRKSQTLSID